MVDLDHVVGFDWDAGNARESAQKHGVSQTEAEEIFWDDRLVISDDEGRKERVLYDDET
jgi:uncharacterized DUF497 family protein